MAAADPQSGLLITSPIDHIEQDQESRSLHHSVSAKDYSLEFWLHTSMMFLVGLGCAVLGAASPRVLEMAICRHYFRHHDPSSIPSDGNIPESGCKIKDIQASFTFMITAVSTCTNLAALLMQIPMGLLADKKSKHLALVLNITSTILYWDWVLIVGYFDLLPTHFLYLTPAFLFIGGGPWATATLIFAAINDEVTPEQRTMAFSIMEAIGGISDILGPVIGSFTILYRLWIPYLIATICFLLMFIPTFLVEDRGLAVPAETVESSASESQSLLNDNDISESPDDQASPKTNLLRSQTAIFATCFGSLFLFYLSADSLNFIVPWVSFRFQLPMAKAGLLFSLRGIVSLVLYLVIFPTVTTALDRKWKLRSPIRDLTLSQWSVILLSLRSFLIAFALRLYHFKRRD